VSRQAIRYIYSIAQTEGTTGYAKCVPEPVPEFATALALLEERPLDDFLHRHLLDRMLGKKPGEWRAMAGSCVARGGKALAALLLETAVLAPDADLGEFLPGLRRLASPWHEATPLVLLAGKPAAVKWREAFWQNIHRHRPLKTGGLPCPEEIAAEAARMAASRGALAKARAGISDAVELEQAPPPEDVYAAAGVVLAEKGIVGSGEMRHEASLCPIALLRQWRLEAGVTVGRNAYVLEGCATAYGRGLKLAQARASCAMEIVERACAHAHVEAGGKWGKIGGRELVRASWADLKKSGVAAVAPSSLGAVAESDGLPLHWLAGRDVAGAEVLVPAQAVYLFCNLDEVSVCSHIGSTGLASGSSSAMAKLGALAEVLERDAHATTPFVPESCFELRSRDPIVAGLLEDYRWRGIRAQFQDISNEFGFPAYRAFVRGRDGMVAQATGSGLSGARAALAALTETPWPYVWAKPVPAPSGPALPDLPLRFLEDLPDFGLPSSAASLALLENALAACGWSPVYVDISRADLGFPVFRAFIPGMETDSELEYGPGRRLLARAFHTI